MNNQWNVGVTPFIWNDVMGAAQIYNPTVYSIMADQGNGNYTYSLVPSKPGTFTLRVQVGLIGGLYFEYYTNPTLSGNPSTYTYTGVNQNWSWTSIAGSGSDNSAAITGFILAPTTDSYNFTLSSDDCSDLWFNNIKLISRFGEQNVWTDSFTVNLSANEIYPIQINYADYGWGAKLQLSWSYGGISNQVIPSQYLIAYDTVTSTPINITTQCPAGYRTDNTNVQWILWK